MSARARIAVATVVLTFSVAIIAVAQWWLRRARTLSDIAGRIAEPALGGGVARSACHVQGCVMPDGHGAPRHLDRYGGYFDAPGGNE